MIGMFDKLLGRSPRDKGDEEPLGQLKHQPSEAVTNCTENSDVGAAMPAQPPPDTPPSLSSSIEKSLESHDGDDFRTSISDSQSDRDSITVQRVPPSLETPATHLPNCEARLSLLRTSPKSEAGESSDIDRNLMEAVRTNNLGLVCQLLSPRYDSDGPNPNSTDSTGRTPLHIATELGSLDLCAMLIDYGNTIDLDARDAVGRTPLHVAVEKGFVETANFLMRCGADVNVQDANGNTPLHYAACRDFDEVLVSILRRGPNLKRKNREGMTAVMVAAPRCATLLREAEVKRNRAPAAPPAPVPLSRIPISEYTQEDVNALMENTPRSHSVAAGTASKRTGPYDFDLVHQLGKGSFGDVYLVQRIADGSLYAMKILRKDKIMSQNLMKYAMTERNVLSYVRHPFIVGLNSAFQTSDKLFLILDYCPGGDMGWHLSKEKRFSEHRARIYSCEVLLALEDLHNRGIIYRDLKPDNVVFDDAGHAMLTDFGLSREGVYDNFSAKSFCGSIAYLAPEVLKRQGHGQAVDWYLLGVLIYEMLVGKPPYFSRNREELFHNIQYGQLTLPSTMSQEAKGLIRAVRPTQLLEREPKNRLGFKGSDEIKTHPFFHGIKWDKVARRELRPPVRPRPAQPSPSIITKERVYGEEGLKTGHHFDGWSFVSQ